MKKFFILLSAFSATLYTTIAQHINLSNKPWNQAMQEIEATQHCRIFYADTLLNTKTVTAIIDSSNILNTLLHLVKPMGLTVNVLYNNYYFITKNSQILVEPQFGDGENAGSGKTSKKDDEKSRFLTSSEAKRAQIFVIGSSISGQAPQTAKVDAHIAQSDGTPITGATLFLPDAGIGAVSDFSGNLSISIIQGTYNAVVSCVGMQTVNCKLQIQSSGKLSIEMTPALIAIREVKVLAKQYQSTTSMDIGLERFNMKMIKQIPALMGEKDILKISQMLPGITSVGEGSAGINVRGGNADQNIFYINEIPVYNTSHLFGFFSAFNPDIVKDFAIYKGHIPVEYDGRLSSVFDISARTGSKTNITAHGGISPITAFATVEGPIGKKISLLASVRTSYSDWILKQLNNASLRNSRTQFYDANGSLTYNLNNSNTFNLFLYRSSDKFSLSNITDYTYRNNGASASWNHRSSDKANSKTTIAASDYNFETIDKTEDSKAYQHTYKLIHIELKHKTTITFNDKNTLEYGGNIIQYQLARGQVKPYGKYSLLKTVSLGNEQGTETGIFIGHKIHIMSWLQVYGGLRYSAFIVPGNTDVLRYEPGLPKSDENIIDTTTLKKGIGKWYGLPIWRLALNIKTTYNQSLKVSANRLSQNLIMLSNTAAVAPNDQWKLADDHIKPANGIQYGLGYYYDLKSAGMFFSLETYWKTMNNISEFKDGANFLSTAHIEQILLQGEQRSYGVELMARKNTGNLNGWLSYSYAKSEITVDGPNVWDKINDGKTYPANFDKPHTVNLVANYRFTRRVSISGDMTYSTGRPVTYPQSIYILNGRSYIDYSSRNAYRIPDYFRIDASLALEGNLKRNKLAHSSWLFSVYNITARKNAYSVYFRSENNNIKGYKYAVIGVPIATLTWIFKFGNYASE